jgi:hypothetical protein
MKAEIRKPKSEDSHAFRPAASGIATATFEFRISGFGFPSDLGFRISDFRLWNVS